MNLLSCRVLTCLLIVSLDTGNFPVVPPQRPPSTTAANASAIPGRLLFFAQLHSSKTCGVLRQAAVWCRGDCLLRPLRKPHHQRLRQCFALMLGDAAATLALPFVGQALYDAASHGAAFPGSFQTMLAVSCLLLMFEGLDPLRRYVQFRLTEVSSGFVADVRTFLLQRALRPADGAWDPARPGLIYLHAPSFAIRNIDMPLKLPLTAAQAILSGWLLWQRDPVVVAVALFTALVLFAWGHRRSHPLAQANKELRQAEAETLAALERMPAEDPVDALRHAEEHFQRVRHREIQQTLQGLWYDGVVDRISTVILMTGVMLWGAWHQYWTGTPSTGQILTLLALAWNVQFKISGLLALAKRRLEAESATFLLTSPGIEPK